MYLQLIFKYDMQTGQIKSCMIKWMENFDKIIKMGQWEKLWEEINTIYTKVQFEGKLVQNILHMV